MAVTIGDNLSAWLRIWRDADDEAKARAACVLSVAAIFMVLVTSAWMATDDQRDALVHSSAVEQPLYKGLVDGSSPSAPTSTDYCPSLRNGQWLQVVVLHRDERGFEYHSCLYGRVQYRAGEGNL